MERNIAWGITGSGAYLFETFKAIKKIKEKQKVKVTTFISRAGEEIIRIYGLLDKLKEVSPGNYYEELVDEKLSGVSNVYSGRFSLKRYIALIVSPATANTVAKIVHGIADTVVTNAVSQAVKGRVPVFVLPVDLRDGEVEITVPCSVNRLKCRGCEVCRPIAVCPYEAVEIVEGLARINLSRCHGCELCVETCPFSAIECWRREKLRTRRIDVENTRKLAMMEGIHVLIEPKQIEKEILRLLRELK